MTELVLRGLDRERFIDSIRCLERNIVPSLQEMGINLHDYAAKLYENSEFVSLLNDGLVVGLAAIYANDSVGGKAFLSFIAIEDGYVNQGWGKRMLLQCEEIARNNGMSRVGLEVFRLNKRAKGFYQAMGYTVCSMNESSYYMEKKLF